MSCQHTAGCGFRKCFSTQMQRKEQLGIHFSACFYTTFTVHDEVLLTQDNFIPSVVVVQIPLCSSQFESLDSKNARTWKGRVNLTKERINIFWLLILYLKALGSFLLKILMSKEEFASYLNPFSLLLPRFHSSGSLFCFTLLLLESFLVFMTLCTLTSCSCCILPKLSDFRKSTCFLCFFTYILLHQCRLWII